MLYFQLVAKTGRNRTGDESKSAYHMAMMFWIKQAKPATRLAYEDKKLDKLTLWNKDGMPQHQGSEAVHSRGLFYSRLSHVI